MSLSRRARSKRYLVVAVAVFALGAIAAASPSSQPSGRTASSTTASVLSSVLASELGAGPPLSAVQAGLSLFPTPPTGFSPLDATAAQLAEYGFAPRPPAGDDQTWVAAMSNWRYNLSDPVIRDLANRPGSVPSQEAGTSPDSIGRNYGFYDSYGYSGNVTGSLLAPEVNKPNGYYEVEASWTIPTVAPTNSNSYSTIWPGIGAYGGGTLVQAGTEQDYLTGSGATYYAWYEACCRTDPIERMVQNFPVHPGDTMFVDVDLNDSSAPAAYSTLVGYDIVDETTGEGMSILENFSPLSGGDADFVLEDPCIGSVGGVCVDRPMLADFETMAFSGAFWGLQKPDNPPDSEYSGACIGEDVHRDPHDATLVPVPPGIPLANPEAFTDPDGCDFPIVRVNPGV